MVIGHQDDAPLVATMDGFLRGVARDGVYAPCDTKLIEIDPRGRAASWTGVDERGRAIAQSTLEAVLAAPQRKRAFAHSSALAN